MNCDYVTICGGGCASHALAKGLKLTEFDPFACKLAKFYLRYFLKRKAIDFSIGR
jgi:sulfatase maturation enzyme AslB (radical SAM superfamily)